MNQHRAPSDTNREEFMKHQHRWVVFLALLAGLHLTGCGRVVLGDTRRWIEDLGYD